MVTAKRSETSSNFYNQNAGGVGLLERPVEVNQEVTNTSVKENDFDQVKANMRRNLDMLLNYGKPTQDVVEAPEKVVEEVKNEASQEDDLRPTFTTMQFGDVDVDTIRSEMKNDTEEKKHYRLTGKGKIAVILYALTVVVVMALIILNTGIISSLNRSNAESFATLTEKRAEYQMLSSEIDSISSNEYVIDKATEMGMVQR